MRRLFGGDPRQEVEDELAFHLEQRIREYLAAGLDEPAARRAALERIGDVASVRSECTQLLVAERRAAARRDWLSDLGQDMRFGVRTALRAPLFTGMAVLTLALGIGANSAVFGVIKSVLLDALPYAEPERLMRVTAEYESQPGMIGALSAGTVYDLKERARVFDGLAVSASGGPDAVVQEESGAQSVRLAWVLPDYFDVLGVTPVLGRSFDTADVETDTAQVVMIAHEVWQGRHGGSADVLGRTLMLNGLPRTVIGVLPASYDHPVERAEYFMPFSLEPLLRNPINARGSHFLEMIGRLESGTTYDVAAGEVAAIGNALVDEYPEHNRGVALRADPLHHTMVGDTRTPLLVLMGAAGLVLLIACANLATALLSRTLARRREFAVRISLGAPRSRLIRQLLAESLLLALAGGALALFVAMAGLAGVRAMDLGALPDYANLSLDVGAVAFTFVLALLTGVAFGLTPAFSAAREEPQSVLRDASRGTSGGRGAGRLRGGLVAAQVALCLSLLAGAGLLTRSLWLMASAPLGVDTGGVLTFAVPLSGPRYSSAEAEVQFREEVLRGIASLPGVESAAMTGFLPTQVGNSNGVTVVGAQRAAGEATPFVLTTGVTRDYFTTLRVPLVEGRTFTSADHLNSPPVVVVSETMARMFWPAGGAVGSRIVVGPDPASTPFEVVGVVADVRTSMVEAEPEALLYTSLEQGWFGNTFTVRTAGDPIAHAAAVREVLRAYDPALPMADIGRLSEIVDEGLAERRLPMLLMLGFAGLALLLACVGIYALFSNLAVSREREFGVRMALGSSRTDVAALVLREGARWMGLGLALGALGVFAVSRALTSLVYGIAPLDAISISVAVSTLIVAAAIALVIPVSRATKADPLTVMR